MSGVEPFIASMLAAAGTTATATTAAAATTTAAAAGTTGAALAGGAAGLAGAAGGGAAGISALGAIEGVAALAGVAGTAQQVLSDGPKIELPRAPTIDDAQKEADLRSQLLKRRGRSVALLTEGGAAGDTSSPYLGSAALLGA